MATQPNSLHIVKKILERVTIEPYSHHRTPESLRPGMNFPKLDPRWAWGAYVAGECVAVLLAADVHGVVFFLKLNALENVEGAVIVKLLREATKQLRERGYSSFITFLDASKAKELKLARIVQRFGGFLLPISGFWAMGKLLGKVR